MVHLLIDEWFCKVLKLRFIGIRIRYVNAEFELVSKLLAIRYYDKSQINKNAYTASELLREWTKSIFREFSIDLFTIFSAKTDSGSEVKYMITKPMAANWDWCVAHMLTNTVKEACGQLKSQTKTPISCTGCFLCAF